MHVMMFNDAVAEYLHRSDRSAPWTRQREEAALDGLSGWLQAQAGAVPLAAVTPRVVSRYAAECRLSAEELEDLHGTLSGLFLWSRQSRRVMG
jgi:hypothetical protein